MEKKILVVSEINQLYINSLLLSIRNISDIYYATCVQDIFSHLTNSSCHLVVLADIKSIEKNCYIIETVRVLKKIPIVVLASGDIEEKKVYINLGADAVLPINGDREEIKLQIYSLMRRYFEWKIETKKQKNIVLREEFIMCFAMRKMFWKGVELKLTKHEFDFMYLISASPERIYTYSQIYKVVWNEYPQGNIANMIRCMIRRIKKKLKAIDSDIPDMIYNIRDIGYFFKLDTDMMKGQILP